MVIWVLLLLYRFVLQYLLKDAVYTGVQCWASLPQDLSAQNCVPQLNPGEYLCGDSLCVCINEKADCTVYDCLEQPEDVYIPRLPQGIRTLLFQNKDLTSADLSEQFFKNVSEIDHLSLAINELTYIPHDVFGLIENLTSLDLSDNPSTRDVEDSFSMESIRYVLSLPTLRQLSLGDCGISTIPRNAFKGLESKVESLLMTHNSFSGTVDLSAFCPLKRLKELSLASATGIKTLLLECVLHLKKLYLDRNILTRLPHTCKGGVSLLPDLEHLGLSYNRIEFLEEACLPKLKLLNLNNNLKTLLVDYTFDNVRFPSLQTLSLNHQSKYDHNRYMITEHAFSNLELRNLSLKGNHFDFSASFIRPHAFSGCVRLQNLILDDNDFLRVDSDRFLQLFGNLSSLTSLSLQDCNLGVVSVKMFADFPHLAELFLGGNRIPYVPDGTFDLLQQLHFLNISGNEISTVNEQTFNANTRQRLSGLILSSDKFDCSCDLLWFRNWLISDHSLFYPNGPSSSYKYECKGTDHTKVEEFMTNEQPCRLSREMNIQIIISCSIAVSALALISLVFRYRWHIRLVLYEAFRVLNDARRHFLQANNFDFDVFVSFASEDLPWVRQHLMPELEDRLGLRLCVHERDFIPGKNIVDNIADCVESSKKILVVFSRDFVRSQWCQFELNLCLHHVIDYDDALIVVCVDDVASRDMTSAMMAVLKTTTYIQWTEVDDVVDAFWGRLRLALRDVMEHADLHV